LVIAAIPERDDPRDVLITRDRAGLNSLPDRAVVGTSSPRRAAFMRALVPGIQPRDIRGNVETRMQKVMRGEYDGAVLALAGLRRLRVHVDEIEILSLFQCPPAPGQGALAIQCRREDGSLRARLEALEHGPTRVAVTAERAVLRELGASCEIPLGAHGRFDDGELVLDAALATPEGVIRASVRGIDPLSLGMRAADQLRQPAHV
jgi:hydroxymethylbilane synthase